MDKLIQEFQLGFQEGWRGFWSPFTGLYRAIAATWHAHIKSSSQNHRHA